ncbi:hypothetical protein CTAYLR_010754 [Chrysophaeum taylorii]|uniref:Uncharacterized protein n=1 Tax=Chrysophaeum taylorii TaxID=2483200 RepID=A0AAD7UJ84_9STRA|nr:hypothetical protein CTAYLR_010754 [Chrysophaeum taylorii]
MEKLEAAVSAAEFISYDEEMTGIGFAGVSFQEFNAYSDKPFERYEKMRKVATAFGIVQLGVTAWVREGGKLVASPFNIFVFPGGDGDDILVSPGAVKFLSEHGMDWREWLDKGVPFVDAGREEEKRVALTRAGDLEFCDRQLARCKALEKGSIQLDPQPNPLVRRYLYQEIERRFPGLGVEKLAGFRIGVTKLTPADRARRLKDIERCRAERLGARRVFLSLSEACRRGVPLVGHNCWFDLLFMMRSFDGPLPASYAEWKRRCRALFPLLYDTKVLAARRGAYGKLDELYAKVLAEDKKNIEIICFANGFDKYSPEREDGEEGPLLPFGEFHEAGWDSFVTGVVFVHFRDNTRGENRLNNMRSPYQISLEPKATLVDEYLDPLSWDPAANVFHVSGLDTPDDAPLHFTTVHHHAFHGNNEWLVDADDVKSLPAAAAAGNGNHRPLVAVTPFDLFAKQQALDSAKRQHPDIDTSGWWAWLRTKLAAIHILSDPTASPPRKRHCPSSS